MAELRVKEEEKMRSLLKFGEATLKFRAVVWYDNRYHFKININENKKNKLKTEKKWIHKLFY